MSSSEGAGEVDVGEPLGLAEGEEGGSPGQGGNAEDHNDTGM